MKAALSLRMGQSLSMTPALQQAIRLLQLSSLDLELEIQQALDGNVMLERDEAEGTDDSAPAEIDEAADDTGVTVREGPEAEVFGDAEVLGESLPVDADWSDCCDLDPSPSSGTPNDELQQFLDANRSAARTLYDHLLEQLQLCELRGVMADIGLHLIDSVDAEGYLREFESVADDLRKRYGVSDAQIDEALETVQGFDPSGVAARDLRECLQLQLWNLSSRTPGATTALRLVEGHLARLPQTPDATLANQLKVSVSEIDHARTLIRSLQPHPGRPFMDHESNYVAPDVFVRRDKDRWQVSLNPAHRPKVRINSVYPQLIKRADASPDQKLMKGHLQEARQFIHALEARNETLLRVAQAIVESQRAFLEYGPEAMRPMVLRDISAQLGIHESTVSRATANKYMATPRGLFELKFFFSSHVSTTEGGTASATAIQAIIKRLVAAEPADQPLSDSALSDQILAEGIKVARRTVAKYREGLGIAPSHERRSVFS
ncbi:RNA polymerase factor sigma-54 [Polycyclovorans algicola]|uniref:RNA polymerase factor sigma-54 n=1 Tax=Polycyclovorans algicola TaxID=616992 RepID=UPI0004A6D0CA|nr:RNA polymerase factor sigma-54 [Polycyclovorans algicola]